MKIKNNLIMNLDLKKMSKLIIPSILFGGNVLFLTNAWSADAIRGYFVKKGTKLAQKCEFKKFSNKGFSWTNLGGGKEKFISFDKLDMNKFKMSTPKDYSNSIKIANKGDFIKAAESFGKMADQYSINFDSFKNSFSNLARYNEIKNYLFASDYKKAVNRLSKLKVNKLSDKYKSMIDVAKLANPIANGKFKKAYDDSAKIDTKGLSNNDIALLGYLKAESASNYAKNLTDNAKKSTFIISAIKNYAKSYTINFGRPSAFAKSALKKSMDVLKTYPNLDKNKILLQELSGMVKLYKFTYNKGQAVSGFENFDK